MALTPDADPRHGRFGLRTECPTCGGNVPVNGPASEVECADCGVHVAVPNIVVSGLLDAFEAAWPAPADAGSITVGDRTWRWTAAAVEGPSCPACGTPLRDDDGLITCGRCAATIPSEPLPHWLTSMVGGATRLIGGEFDVSRAEHTARPVALACPSCAAGLSITSRHHRITACDRCSSQVHIPDVVWRALHPPRTVQPWFIRFEGESRPARAQKEKAELDARKRAEAERSATANADAARRRVEELAEQQRLATQYGMPLLVLAAVASAGAVVLMGAATSWFFVVQGSQVPLGMSTFVANLLQNGLVVLALGATVVAWLLGIVAATRRAGTSSSAVLPWSIFMAVMSVIPMLGPVLSLFFAWRHFVGAEPTVGTDEDVPQFAGWPLAFIHLFGGGFSHIAYAALTQIILGLFYGYR